MEAGVFVTIVTYNRPTVLATCLESLTRQGLTPGDRIHVVVNSGDAETIETIQAFGPRFEAEISFERLSNEGPAGGFYAGIKKFLTGSSCRYVWLMDDDIEIQEGCLAELLKSAPGTGYLCPTVVTHAGSEVDSFGWWGVLLDRKLVSNAGLPRRDLFYWAEDSEYLQYRIVVKAGIQPIKVVTAKVKHLHNRSDKHPSWYYYYVMRNTLIYRLHIRGITRYGFGLLLRIVPYLVLSIFSRERHKFLKLRLLMREAFDGLAGKTGKSVDPVKYN